MNNTVNQFHMVKLRKKKQNKRNFLEQQYQAATEKYKEKRQQILDYQEVLAHLENVISSLAEDEKNHLQNIGFLETKIGTINKELEEQEQKKERINNITDKLIQDIKKKQGLKKNDFFPEEFEVSLKELKEFYSLIINKIAELIKDNPELKLKVDNEFDKIGISLTKALSRQSLSSHNSNSSRANSRMSSRISSRANSRAESRADSIVDSGVNSRASSRLSNSSKSTVNKVEIGLELNDTNKNGSSSSLKKKSNSSLNKQNSTSNSKLNNK
jgi:hypothetical protein